MCMHVGGWGGDGWVFRVLEADSTPLTSYASYTNPPTDTQASVHV